ncbi:hypothetical protein DFH06DRAFT_1447735 [Mycena polygramma]|nr:hypothetical protein DFH06DRAFT_1447735 [Mycena polygramma]
MTPYHECCSDDKWLQGGNVQLCGDSDGTLTDYIAQLQIDQPWLPSLHSRGCVNRSKTGRNASVPAEQRLGKIVPILAIPQSQVQGGPLQGRADLRRRLGARTVTACGLRWTLTKVHAQKQPLSAETSLLRQILRSSADSRGVRRMLAEQCATATDHATEHAEKSDDKVKFIVVGDVAVGRTKGGIVGRRYPVQSQPSAVLSTKSIPSRNGSRAASAPSPNLVLARPPAPPHPPPPSRPTSSKLGWIHNEPGNARLSPVPPLAALVPLLLDHIASTTDAERAFLPFKDDGNEVVLLVNNLGGLSELEITSELLIWLTQHTDKPLEHARHLPLASPPAGAPLQAAAPRTPRRTRADARLVGRCGTGITRMDALAGDRDCGLTLKAGAGDVTQAVTAYWGSDTSRSLQRDWSSYMNHSPGRCAVMYHSRDPARFLAVGDRRRRCPSMYDTFSHGLRRADIMFQIGRLEAKIRRATLGAILARLGQKKRFKSWPLHRPQSTQYTTSPRFLRPPPPAAARTTRWCTQRRANRDCVNPTPLVPQGQSTRPAQRKPSALGADPPAQLSCGSGEAWKGR